LDYNGVATGRGATIPLRGGVVAELREFLADELAVLQARARKTGEAVPMRLPAILPLFTVPRDFIKIFDRDLAAASISKRDDRDRTVAPGRLAVSLSNRLPWFTLSARKANRRAGDRRLAGVFSPVLLLNCSIALRAIAGAGTRLCPVDYAAQVEPAVAAWADDVACQIRTGCRSRSLGTSVGTVRPSSVKGQAMYLGRMFAICVVLVAADLRAVPEARAARKSAALEIRFPEIARLIRHFGVRMCSKHAAVRLEVLTELTYFHPRDSKLYPPFLRYLLTDPSPKIRWEAIRRLREHGVFLRKDELPESYQVPIVGLCRPKAPKSLQRLRKMLADPNDVRAGWAVTALAAAKDSNVLEWANRLAGSRNVFVRFSAACACLELGQRDKALKLIRTIADTDHEASGFYKMSAAELMVRHGYKEYIGTLIEAVAGRFGQGYADAGIGVLADLTGKYYPTPSEWKAWWDEQRRLACTCDCTYGREAGLNAPTGRPCGALSTPGRTPVGGVGIVNEPVEDMEVFVRLRQ